MPRADAAPSFLVYPLAIDFANSVGMHVVGQAGELLGDEDGFARWVAVQDELSGVDTASVDLTALQELRRHVIAILGALARRDPLPAMDVVAINDAAARAVAHPVLDLSDPAQPAARSVTTAATATDAVLGRVAASLIDLVAARVGVRRCPAPGCGLFFLASRSDQRWCTGSCGNRARVARYQRRHRDRQPPRSW